MTTTQQNQAWADIRQQRQQYLNRHDEFNRLLGYWEAKRNAPHQAVHVTTKRAVKHAKTATGQRGLKVFGMVSADCHIERVFVTHK